MKTTNEEWSIEQMTILQKMWEKGATNSEIGQALGKTRGAVAGKIHRNKVKWKLAEVVEA